MVVNYMKKLIIFLSLTFALSANAQNTSPTHSSVGKLNKSGSNSICADNKLKKSIVYYSTRPGEVASDGVGRNGLYTGALVHELKTTENSIDYILNRVSLYVADKSNGSQNPTSVGSFSNGCFSQLNFKDALKRYPKKFALIIGNSNYPSFPLGNPINDSNDVAEFFKGQGFEVLQINDMLQRDFNSIDYKLKKRISKDSVFVFYYAGHAIQIDDESYFFPIDINLGSFVKNDLLRQSLQLKRVIDTVNSLKSSVDLYFIDASRDNPF